MTFVDTNVFMYAVGRDHPLKEVARRFFEDAIADRAVPLATSAEVLQELLHAYLPVERMGTHDAAIRLLESCVGDVWSIEADDVRLARDLTAKHPSLGARDLLHAACCVRRGVTRVKTFDRGLASCFPEPA
ncbi:MAG: type II toxin-antitoxin system VapC family toxin [bacterium]|nr:type II toxin-antitoxin system VapC family toxin [bacterium]